jgi:hypothetical protein
VEEVSSQEAESTLKEGGKHHNLICVGCWNVFPSDRTPLQHCMIGEEVVRNELVNLALIHDGWLEKVQVRGGHG